MHTEKPGKTIFLLKQGAKPYSPSKPRRKIQILGTFDQYKESKKKPQPPADQPVQNLIIPQIFAPQGKKDKKDA